MSSEPDADLWSRSPAWFRRPEVLHAGAAVLIGSTTLLECVLSVFGDTPVRALVMLILTVAGAVIARWYPWPGLCTAAAGCVLTAVLGGNPIAVWAITVFTLFSFTLAGNPVVRGISFVGPVLYITAAIAAGYDFVSPAAFAGVVTAVAGSAIGAGLRIHQQYWRSLEQRAADAVATRESEGTRRVIEERLRIARDLHDVVGHQVAVVSMHLGVAEVNLPAGAGPARGALVSARTAVRSVLVETQRILNVLRRGATDDGAAGQPAPQLSRLPELVDSFRHIGLRVDATLGELPDDVDPAVSLTAFRIVQEALTNAHRHGTGSAELSVTCTDGLLLIEVINERRRDGTRVPGGGYGLLGVRERVTSAGGALAVVDDDERRFRLSVVLMTDGSDLE